MVKPISTLNVKISFTECKFQIKKSTHMQIKCLAQFGTRSCLFAHIMVHNAQTNYRLLYAMVVGGDEAHVTCL